jgi:pimeloyl-ACP methyl ester carboxylesterase
MRRVTLPVFVICLFVSVESAQQLPTISWEPFSFEAPVVGQTSAERGWLEVPVRHARPTEGRIRLPVVRLKTNNPNPGPPVIFLAGGPGNVGTRLTGLLASHATRIRAFADVVAFDQRGTGAAEPSLTVPGRFDLPPTLSFDSAEVRQRFAALGDLIRTTVQSRGIDLSAYNTMESADDIDDLRRALGAETVVLWGHSYGTHLALAVIKRHETQLGGVNGLDDRWRDPADSDAWLGRVATAMQAAAPTGVRVDFVEQVKRVFAQLDKDPIRVPTPTGEVLVGKSEIQVLVTVRSGDLAFVQDLPVLFDSLEKRRQLDGIATQVQQTVRQRPIGTAMTYAMHVASGVSDAHAARIREQAPNAIFGNAINWGLGDEEFVKALAVTDLGEMFRAPFRSNVPVLLMSGTLDGRAGENDARGVGAQFERASYVTLDGASHDFWFLRAPPQVSEITYAFLRGESVGDERIAWPLSFRWPN